MDLKSLFVQYALPLIITGLSALAGLALKKLADFLAAKGQSNKILAVSAKVALFTDSIVNEIENVLKPEIQAAAADGKITPEEYAKMKTDAVAAVKNYLGENGLKEIEDVLGIAAPSIEGFLGGLVEKAVSGLTGGGPSAPAPVAAKPAGNPT